jgi:hypothetical protein
VQDAQRVQPVVVIPEENDVRKAAKRCPASHAVVVGIRLGPLSDGFQNGIKLYQEIERESRFSDSYQSMASRTSGFASASMMTFLTG